MSPNQRPDNWNSGKFPAKFGFIVRGQMFMIAERESGRFDWHVKDKEYPHTLREHGVNERSFPARFCFLADLYKLELPGHWPRHEYVRLNVEGFTYLICCETDGSFTIDIHDHNGTHLDRCSFRQLPNWVYEQQEVTIPRGWYRARPGYKTCTPVAFPKKAKQEYALIRSDDGRTLELIPAVGDQIAGEPDDVQFALRNALALKLSKLRPSDKRLRAAPIYLEDEWLELPEEVQELRLLPLDERFYRATQMFLTPRISDSDQIRQLKEPLRTIAWRFGILPEALEEYIRGLVPEAVSEAVLSQPRAPEPMPLVGRVGEWVEAVLCAVSDWVVTVGRAGVLGQGISFGVVAGGFAVWTIITGGLFPLLLMGFCWFMASLCIGSTMYASTREPEETRGPGRMG